MFISHNGVGVNDISADELKTIESSWPKAEPLDLSPYMVNEEAEKILYSLFEGVKLNAMDRSFIDVLSGAKDIQGIAVSAVIAYLQSRKASTSISHEDMMTIFSLSKKGANSAIKSFKRHPMVEVETGSGTRKSRYSILTKTLS